MIMRMSLGFGRAIRQEMSELARIGTRITLDADWLPRAENRMLPRTGQLLAGNRQLVKDHEPVIVTTSWIVDKFVSPVQACGGLESTEDRPENLDPQLHTLYLRLILRNGTLSKSRT